MEPMSDFLHIENLRIGKQVVDNDICPLCGGSGIVANEKGEASPVCVIWHKCVLAVL